MKITISDDVEYRKTELFYNQIRSAIYLIRNNIGVLIWQKEAYNNLHFIEDTSLIGNWIPFYGTIILES